MLAEVHVVEQLRELAGPSYEAADEQVTCRGQDVAELHNIIACE